MFIINNKKIYITLVFLFCLSIAYSASIDLAKSRETAITTAISLASDSVVGVSVTKIKQQRMNPFLDPFWNDFFPQRTYKVESFGSGVIIDSDGYVVTNEHVIHNAKEIIVTTVGGKKHVATTLAIFINYL